MSTELVRRLSVSAVLILVLSLLIGYALTLVGSTIVTLVLAAFSIVGMWEYIGLAQAKKLRPAKMILLSAASSTITAFSVAVFFPHFARLPVVFLALALVVLFFWRFKDPAQSLTHIAIDFFALIYIAVPLGLMLGVLYPNGYGSDGRWWLVYLLVVTKVTDAGAYFIGQLWGRHALSKLSPKKTIEGAAGGIACALVSSIAIWVIAHTSAPKEFSLGIGGACGLGVLLGVVAQMGDLGESLFKRDASVKDSNVIPGLGGVLDILDSLLVTTPIVYFIASL